MSLKLMTFKGSVFFLRDRWVCMYILVPEMLEELELPIRTLGKHWSAEGFHNLLDCHRLPSELVLC